MWDLIKEIWVGGFFPGLKNKIKQTRRAHITLFWRELIVSFEKIFSELTLDENWPEQLIQKSIDAKLPLGDTEVRREFVKYLVQFLDEKKNYQDIIEDLLFAYADKHLKLDAYRSSIEMAALFLSIGKQVDRGKIIKHSSKEAGK